MMLVIYVLFSALAQTASVTTASLKPCPDKPNCVSSQADASDSEHYMPALSFTIPSEEVLAAAEEVLIAMPRSTLESKTENSLHVTFRSRIFRFVDDVEVVIDASASQLHFRSAARVGHSDLGVNRKRMTDFVAKLKEQLPKGALK